MRPLGGGKDVAQESPIMETAPLDFAALTKEIRRSIERLDPGARRVILHIIDGDGQHTQMDIICSATPFASEAPLTETEQEILQVFDEATPDEVLSRPEIAKRVGCDDGSHFRERLGRLVRLRKLINERPGYRRA
jgi:hypothetical protein